jgi:hypothetical protein
MIRQESIWGINRGYKCIYARDAKKRLMLSKKSGEALPAKTAGPGSIHV